MSTVTVPRPRRWTIIASRAIVSRVFVVSLSLVSNLALPNHTPEGAAIFNPDKYGGYLGAGVATVSSSSSWWMASLSTFTRWDAAHFLSIAERGGYDDEQSHAFFPGYPATIRILATTFLRLLPEGWGLPFDEALIMAAVMVSNVSFVVAAVGLYMLSIIVLGSERRAFRSALLFCANPASVFMSTAYSESLYAAVAFWGLWMAVRCWPNMTTEDQCSIPTDGVHGNTYALNTVLGAVLLAFASATRSVGVINSVIGAWIVVLYAVRSLGLAAKTGHNTTKRGSQQTHKGGATRGCFVGSVCSMSTMLALITAVIYVAASTLPPLLFDWYGRAHLCLTPPTPPAWCATTATVYNHVQRTYWNVGPLRYWRIKQLPNFALATPAAALCGHCVVAHARHVLTRPRPLLAVLSPSAWGSRGGVLPFSALPFVAVWAAVTMFGILVINVQVLTRLVCAACPAFYWYAEMVLRERPAVWAPVIGTVVVAYNMAGPLLHSNFYPWT